MGRNTNMSDDCGFLLLVSEQERDKENPTSLVDTVACFGLLHGEVFGCCSI
jgi:hypothetical protein